MVHLFPVFAAELHDVALSVKKHFFPPQSSAQSVVHGSVPSQSTAVARSRRLSPDTRAGGAVVGRTIRVTDKGQRCRECGDNAQRHFARAYAAVPKQVREH